MMEVDLHAAGPALVVLQISTRCKSCGRLHSEETIPIERAHMLEAWRTAMPQTRRQHLVSLNQSQIEVSRSRCSRFGNEDVPGGNQRRFKIFRVLGGVTLRASVPMKTSLSSSRHIPPNCYNARKL